MKTKVKKERSVFINAICDRYTIIATLTISLVITLLIFIILFVSDRGYLLTLPWYIWLGLFMSMILFSIFLYLLVFVLMKIVVIIPMERQEEVEKKNRKKTIFDRVFKLLDKNIEFVNEILISFLIGFADVIVLLPQFIEKKLPNLFLVLFSIFIWSIFIKLIRRKYFPNEINKKIILPVAIVLSVGFGSYIGVQRGTIKSGLLIAGIMLFFIYWLLGELPKTKQTINKRSE